MYIRSVHPYGYRNGEWGRVRRLMWFNGRPCFDIRFGDGICDIWPVYDPDDPYEFKEVSRVRV